MSWLLGWLCAAEQQAFLVGSSQAAILHVGEDDLHYFSTDLVYISTGGGGFTVVVRLICEKHVRKEDSGVCSQLL